jgi:thioredoxin-like negative regulator of GroEL
LGALAVALSAAPAWSQPEGAPAATALADTLGPATQQQLARALQAEGAGDWRRAEAAYELVTLRAPGFSPALLGLGRARLAQGDRSGAQEAWRRLPSDPEAVSLLAGLVEDDDPAAAAALYQRLTRLRPGETAAWLDLARARAAAGEIDAGLAALRHWQALEDGPPDGAVALGLSRALQEAGREEDAIALLEDFLGRGGAGESAEQARHRLDRMAV